MTDSLEALALEEVIRGWSAQQATLESIRNRVSALIPVAALALGLLGGVLTGKKVDAASWVAFGCFVAVALCALNILRPRFFVFRYSIEDLIREADEHPDAKLASVQRDWALWGSNNYSDNQKVIDRLLKWYEIGLGLLVIQMTALVIHLAR